MRAAADKFISALHTETAESASSVLRMHAVAALSGVCSQALHDAMGADNLLVACHCMKVDPLPCILLNKLRSWIKLSTGFKTPVHNHIC